MRRLKRIGMAAAGVALLLALAGCGQGVPKPGPAVAQAAEGFTGTAQVDGTTLTLGIEPLRAGENSVTVTTDNADVTAIETQLVMASMGHGGVVDLAEIEQGRFEASTRTMNMEGKWLVRVKATLASGEVKDKTFHVEVQP